MDFKNITDPENNKSYSIHSKEGRKVLYKFLNQIKKSQKNGGETVNKNEDLDSIIELGDGVNISQFSLF